eukprot:725592-Rhodomonas_salina.3
MSKQLTLALSPSRTCSILRLARGVKTGPRCRRMDGVQFRPGQLTSLNFMRETSSAEANHDRKPMKRANVVNAEPFKPPSPTIVVFCDQIA